MSSLENGLRILSLLNEDRQVLRVGEVCRDLGLPKASVSRLMKALAEAGLLERERHDQGYVVGGKALDLGALYLARHGLLDLVRVAIDELVRKFGFTGHAGILSGHERVLLAAQQGTYPLQHTGAIAERIPAFDSVIGRVILARLGDDQALAQVDARGKQGLRAAMSDDEVRSEFAAIRANRIARTSSLIKPGISSIGAAVADPARNEIMGFCMSFPTLAADLETQDQIATDVARHAHAIGVRMRDPIWASGLGG